MNLSSNYEYQENHFRFLRHSSPLPPLARGRKPRGWGYDVRDAAILIVSLWGILWLLWRLA